MPDETSSAENADGKQDDNYNPLKVNAEYSDEALRENGIIMEYEDVDLPYRDTDHITDVVNGLHVGEDVIVQLGTDDIDVYHEGKIVSRNLVGVEPFDWDNVICFNVPPNDESETRRYVTGEMSSEVGLWYVISFGYDSVTMNEIATDDVWGHGWIIDIARG